MSIMTRVLKIFKADIHGVMDQLEDRELLLKQHLRDMKAALDQKEAGLNTMLTARRQTQNDCDRYQRQLRVLEQDLAVAIRKNKDDVARKLIKKVKPINDLVDELTGHLRALEEEISHAGVNLDQQRLQYERIKHKSAEFLRRTQFETASAKMPHPDPDGFYAELSEEEVEWELLKRKDALNAA